MVSSRVRGSLSGCRFCDLSCSKPGAEGTTTSKMTMIADRATASISSSGGRIMPGSSSVVGSLEQGVGMIRIRHMTLADVPLGMRLKTAAGWNQVEADWLRMLALEPDGCFVAEWDGE